jgi:Arylsulfotransferase (ASST)
MMRARVMLIVGLVGGCVSVCLAACGSSSGGSGGGAMALATANADPVAAAAATANPVAVSPMPGTPDASPHTQISFLGGPGTRVSHVRVVGSRSGAHGGRLKAYSTGTGESFLPSHRFSSGERVTVHALVSPGSGQPAKPASTAFRVIPETAVSQKQFPNNPGSAADVQHYVSAPTLTPSSVRITTQAQPGATPGDLFMAPYQGKGTPGPMIAEQNGALVWFHPLPAGMSSTNFHVQSYDGRPVLTWWQGRILEVGFGQGEDVIYDTSYRPVAYVHAGNGYHADLHEFRLTPEGTAWIDAFDPIHMNLSRYHGASDGIVNDSVVQEIDVKTGLVMWEWHAIGHIALSESHSAASSSASRPWDYVHVNSVDPGSAGDVLLSSRGTWALYDVGLRTGQVHWRLGGDRSSFRLGPGTRTYWQHDAEWQPGGLISVFDNGSTPPKEKQSRGLLLRPSTATHTVTLVHAYTNPHYTLLASSQGNLLNLSGVGGPETSKPGYGTAPAPNTAGNWLMGYGGLPNFTEYAASGHVLLDGTLGRNVQDFRTYLSPWSGHPTTAPSLAIASHAGGKLTVAASWNGATEVASWRVLAGASPSSLAPVASAGRSGFQTTVAVPVSSGYVAVQALSTTGAAIGNSPAVKV